MPCGTLKEGEIVDLLLPYSYSNSAGANYTTDIMGGRAGKVRITSGQCIPNFHKRKKSGELLPHTYFRGFERTNDHSSRIMQSYSKDGFTSSATGSNWNSGVPFAHVTEEDLDVDMTEASYFVQKAAADIYSGFHDSLTFLVELRKIRTLWEGMAEKLIKLDIMNINLNARYGWRPLLGDFENLTKAVNALGDESRKIWSSNKGENFSYEETSLSTVAVGTHAHFNVTEKFFRDWSLRGSVNAKIEPPKFSFNPVITGYEVIPYSFVADWVINIGQAIQAMSFAFFASEYKASMGTYIDCRREVHASIVYDNPAYSGVWTCEGYDRVVQRKRVPSSLPLQPQVKLRLDPWKIFDLISLIRQPLSKIYHRR